MTGPARLSVVLPAFREDRIGTSVARVRDELAHLVGGVEIVVVDDGSGDGTAEVARAAGADVVVELAINQGKGGAVRSGVAAAGGRTIAFTDADLSYHPAQLERLLIEVEAGSDVVVGNRHHADTRTVVQASTLRAFGGRAINGATRLVLDGRHDDTQCGIKAFRADVAHVLFEHLMIRGFAFDVEVLLLAERAGLTVRDVPVEVENSERSTVNVARDAARLLGDLWTIRRTARDGGYDDGIATLRALRAPSERDAADPEP